MTPITRFLVIDDDPLCNLITELWIKEFNPEIAIKIFTDPEKALSFIQAEEANGGEIPATILLLDINMPFMSGWEFLEEYQHLSSHTQEHFNIHMVSSSIDISDQEQAQNHPLVSGFISKPLTIENLGHMTKN